MSWCQMQVNVTIMSLNSQSRAKNIVKCEAQAQLSSQTIILMIIVN